MKTPTANLGRWKVNVGMATILAGLLLGGASCSKDVVYTYYDVHVTVDMATVTSTQLYLITSCEAQVVGPGIDETLSLRCRPNKVDYEVGTFEWTTDTSGVPVQFIVRVLNANYKIIGQTSSEPVMGGEGTRTKLDVVVAGLNPPSVDAGTTPETGDPAVLPDGGVDPDATPGDDADDDGPAAI